MTRNLTAPSSSSEEITERVRSFSRPAACKGHHDKHQRPVSLMTSQSLSRLIVCDGGMHLMIFCRSITAKPVPPTAALHPWFCAPGSCHA